MSATVVTEDRFAAPRPTLARRLAREVPLLVVLYVAYQMGRVVAGHHATEAFLNAEQIWDIERWLHLPSEAALQQWAWHWPGLIRAANAGRRLIDPARFEADVSRNRQFLADRVAFLRAVPPTAEPTAR